MDENQTNSSFELQAANLSFVHSQKDKSIYYFQKLQNRLLSKSSKISSLIGSTNIAKLTKSQSLNLQNQQIGIPLPKYDKSILSTFSFSPSKKHRNPEIRKNNFQLSPKIHQTLHKPSTAMSNALQKLIRLKQNIMQKRSSNRSSASSFQNQRNVAYDYNFALNQKLIKHQSNTQKKIIENARQILKHTSQQKKKMMQTISTTSSIQQYQFLPKQQQTHASLSDFKILKPLGQGKFGTVYLAKHHQSKMVFALKKIPKKFQDQSIMQQLMRQIKIQSFLDHPNICQLYTFFEQGQFVYLVLELCYSGNLFNELRKEGRFGEDKVRNIIRQICYAIQYLHEHDIIHRDIKPENIILHEVMFRLLVQEIVKLCDFGWSVHSPLSRGTLCGTPIYASPELVLRKQYDSKIDIWNIGVLTYQLLYGRVPFEIRCQQDLQKVVYDLFIKISEEIYFPKSIQISDLCKDFIRQCLNKNPQFRISIVKLLDHDFVNQVQRGK